MAQAEEKRQYNSHQEPPSMEEILSSIRGVISGEDDEEDDDILELTEIIHDGSALHSDNIEEPYLEKSILDDIDVALGVSNQNNQYAQFSPSKDTAGENEATISINNNLNNIVDGTTGHADILDIDLGNNTNPFNSQSQINTKTLLSEETIQQSSISLKTLVNSINDKNSSSVHTRSGTTLEELVIEALKPFLAEWLNKNLSVIVKKIVEKEVKRLIPKEEDDN